MARNNRYEYYVEGQCEKKLLEVFKEQKNMILSGKIHVFNPIQELFKDLQLRTIQENTTVILVFDSDTDNLGVLPENISYLENNARIKEVWCVIQVRNLEDEIIRASSDLRSIKDLTGSRTNREAKHDFIMEKNLYLKMCAHGFDFSKIWITTPGGAYARITNDGEKIKIG